MLSRANEENNMNNISSNPSFHSFMDLLAVAYLSWSIMDTHLNRSRINGSVDVTFHYLKPALTNQRPYP